ncbi:MAG: hypothetical protein NT117_03200 [Gammaproteobacteria bacterium]|nr:hypothetical protein [Gammaproteobacteria bacterium]
MRNIVAKVGLVITLVCIAWFWSRWDAIGLDRTALTNRDLVLLFATALAGLSTVTTAVSRAYAARQTLWLVLVVLLWPLSYLYVLVVNRGNQVF